MKNNKKSLFGLPQKVIHCKKCLMTNQKPFSMNESKNNDNQKIGMKIFSDGICAACKYSENKDHLIDWKKREKLLQKTLDKFRRTDGRYDCIVSGSGGKDSSSVSHILKYKYNMNPLTVTFSPILYTDIGWKNIRAWIQTGGFDNILFTPNGKVSSVLAKEAFKNLLHPLQPFKFGIKTIAAKMAIKYDIQLVMFGEPYAEYGSQDTDDTLSPSYNEEWFINDSNNIFLGGLSINEIKKKYSWISKNDLSTYLPLKSKDLKNKKLSVEFLGWYLKWNPQEMYYYAVENCGYNPDNQRTDGTYARYVGVDDKFEWLHFFCSYIKFGIGRCRFDACQEIRSGHITREEAIKLCKKFEGEYPKRYIDDCYKFMGLNKKEAMKIIDNFRSPHLWKKINNKWVRLQELKEII